MSHTATVKTELRSRQMIQRAAKAMKLECSVGDFTQTFYQGTPQKGDVLVKLPGWSYPVLINTKTAEVHFDNFNGIWGEAARLDDLIQEYSLLTAEDELQQFVLEGWTITRQKQPNGDVQLIIEQ